MSGALGALLQRARAGAALLLYVTAFTVRGALRPAWAPGELMRQLYQLGNRSLLFILVTLGFIGMVMVFQTCLQINRVTGDLSQVGAEFARFMVHALGPSLTALMLATRVGAGIAAEIGSMVVTEQVDALRMSGVEPVEYLLVPRFLASLLMMVVLWVMGVLSALAMGALTAYQSFHVVPDVFVDLSRIRLGDVLTGLIKSLCFGAAVPLVSGFCGMSAKGGSEGVGWATTQAVVSSSFAVIVLDFILSSVAMFTLQAGG